MSESHDVEIVAAKIETELHLPFPLDDPELHAVKRGHKVVFEDAGGARYSTARLDDGELAAVCARPDAEPGFWLCTAFRDGHFVGAMRLSEEMILADAAGLN